MNPKELFNRVKAQAGRLLKYERGSNYELGHSLSSTAVSTIFGKGGSPINVLEEYNGFAWRCINIRAETLADQDLFVERLVGKEWQADLNHEFNEVLEGGESQCDLSELLEAHEKSMCMYGESFWYFSKQESKNKPYGVYLLDPSAMTVMVSGPKVVGYVYQKDSDRVTFETDEIAHFKIYSHKTPFRGYGPMQAAGWFIKSARYTVTYINNFLENNAIPAGVIVAKGDVNDDDWTLFKKQWAEKYSGIENSGKTGYIRSSDLAFVKTGMNLGEADFDKIKESNRNDIMIMFGISKPMMAIFDDINRASAITARQLFAITLTSPSLKRISRKLSKKVAGWYGKQYRVGSTDPIPEDDEAKLMKFDKLVGRVFTVNEARAAYGEEPLKGDEFDSVNPAPAPAQLALINATSKSQADPTPSKSLGKITITKSRGMSYEMKENFRDETEELQHKYEKQFLKDAHPVLKEQKEMVLDQLKPKKVLDTNMDADKEAGKLANAVLQNVIEMAKQQGQLAIEFAMNEDSTFDMNPAMEKYVQDSILKASLNFTRETQAKIAQALQEGLEEGESIASIGKRISAVYDEALGIKEPGYRIERLARTEVIKTSNEITEAAYKQTGAIHKKEWFANPGCCEFCDALDGSIVQLGGTFVPKEGKVEGTDGGEYVNAYENVEHPPIHPQCRCTLVPVIED